MITCDYCKKKIINNKKITQIEISIFESNGCGEGEIIGEYHYKCAIEIQKRLNEILKDIKN